jgi:hypothetical protein
MQQENLSLSRGSFRTCAFIQDRITKKCRLGFFYNSTLLL